MMGPYPFMIWRRSLLLRWEASIDFPEGMTGNVMLNSGAASAFWGSGNLSNLECYISKFYLPLTLVWPSSPMVSVDYRYQPDAIIKFNRREKSLKCTASSYKKIGFLFVFAYFTFCIGVQCTGRCPSETLLWALCFACGWLLLSDAMYVSSSQEYISGFGYWDDLSIWKRFLQYLLGPAQMGLDNDFLSCCLSQPCLSSVK